MTLKDRGASWARGVQAVHRGHLSAAYDRIIGTSKGMGLGRAGFRSKNNKLVNPCRKAEVAVWMQPVMGGGVMASSQF